MRRRPTQDDWQRVHDIGDAPPPSASTKWASWLSVVALWAILGASIYAIGPWFQRFTSSRSSHPTTQRFAEGETTGRFFARGAIGFGIGIVIGSVRLAIAKRKKIRLDP